MKMKIISPTAITGKNDQLMPQTIINNKEDVTTGFEAARNNPA